MKEQRLTDHEYDGIQEYDNPMPAWWKNLFWATIAFSAAYFAYYELGPGPAALDEYALEVGAYEAQHPVVAATGRTSEAELQNLATDPDAVQRGREKFAQLCAPCHGDNGEGKIGPNLTDEVAIHCDGTLSSILKVVSEGVLEKGMPAWEKQLRPEDLASVVAYLSTITGTNLPGKPPQGEKRLAPRADDAVQTGAR
jgi:cytochrome c oxidase cbb3-type subunit III